jgi:Spy/CpxP family protein refolding chaperone
LAREAETIEANLENLLAEPQPDEARALELANQICQLRAKQYQRYVQSILFVRETLSPEQFTLLSNK